MTSHVTLACRKDSYPGIDQATVRYAHLLNLSLHHSGNIFCFTGKAHQHGKRTRERRTNYIIKCER